MSYTVIVLEDNALCMDVVCATLERAGHHPLRASTLEQSLRYAESSASPIALLIADQLLPSCSGTEVAAAVSSTRPEIKTLFISGTPPKFWTSQAQDQLANLPPSDVAFLAKPFRPAELLRRLHQLLGTRAEGVTALLH